MGPREDSTRNERLEAKSRIGEIVATRLRYWATDSVMRRDDSMRLQSVCKMERCGLQDSASVQGSMSSSRKRDEPTGRWLCRGELKDEGKRVVGSMHCGLSRAVALAICADDADEMFMKTSWVMKARRRMRCQDDDERQKHTASARRCTFRRTLA